MADIGFDLQKLGHLSHLSQKIVELVQDPEMQVQAAIVAKSPHLKWIYAGFVAVSVFYWLLKRRVLAATDRWWLRLVLRLCLAVVFFLGQFLMAYAVLGQSVVEIGKLLWRYFS